MPRADLVTVDKDGVVVNEADSVELGTLRASSPAALLVAAKAIATPLAQLIDDANLVKTISGRRFVMCEGWTALAAMLGCTPHEVHTVEEPEGVFTATVELRRLSDGAVVSRASAECGSDDEVDRSGRPVWGSRPRYARRSMAQTRATAKACRLAFSWVMVAAGYSATPAEEVPSGGFDDDEPTERTAPRRPAKAKAAQRAAVIPFGTQKDKPLSECSEDHLREMREWVLEKQTEKNDPKFYADFLQELENELAGRGQQGDAHEDD